MGEMAETNQHSCKKAVAFLIGTEFCERFAFYGTRTILILYLNQVLLYSQNESTIIYHVFNCFMYISCILGTLLADELSRKIRVIWCVSLIYVWGCISLAMSSTVDAFGMSPRALTLVGLVLVAFGSGCVKTFVSAFAGEQFQALNENNRMVKYFSVFYIIVHAASLVSTALTPVLQEDVYCFGKQHCYPLAFGVPGVLMLCGLVIFLAGKRFYKVVPGEKDQLGLVVFVAIFHGFVAWLKSCNTDRRLHFLDYVKDKYGNQIIADIKSFLRIFILFIPMPMFWALFDQQGSRWTFQATMMDGQLGTVGLKPEHMQLINPLLIIVFIPAFEYWLYPLLRCCGIKRPLQKLIIGGMFAALAFLVSGALELSLQNSFGQKLTPGVCQLRIFNGMAKCDYRFDTSIPGMTSFMLPSMSHFEALNVPIESKTNLTYSFYSSNPDCAPSSGEFNLESNNAVSYFITGQSQDPSVQKYHDSPQVSANGKSHVRVLFSSRNTSEAYFIDTKGNAFPVEDGQLLILNPADYDLCLGGKLISKFQAKRGDVITVVLANEGYNIHTVHIAPPRTIHMLWQIPQYVLITMAEVMFSITGLEFLYSQVAKRMKSTVQVCWLMAVAIGNLTIVVVAKYFPANNMPREFSLFAILMVCNIMFFVILAYCFVPLNVNKSTVDEEC